MNEQNDADNGDSAYRVDQWVVNILVKYSKDYDNS